MLRLFRADLHIHTCLSPCADLNMGPRAIVNKARQHGLDVIGICDHNSSENVPAVVRAARDTNLKVLPGMEVTSKEEVHVLALFDTLERALRLQEIVYEHLPGENDAEAFGPQVVVNEDHDVLGFNPRLLAGATEKKAEAVRMLAELEGLFLDPVYTASSMACLIDLARKGFFKKDDVVVFLHTGGSAALFAYKEPLRAFGQGKKIPWTIPPWSPDRH